MREYLMEIIAGIGVTLFAAFGLWLKSLIDKLPKVLLAFGESLVVAASKTEDKGDDLRAGAARFVIEKIVVPALEATIGKRREDKALVPPAPPVTVTVDGKEILDRRANSRAAEEVATEKSPKASAAKPEAVLCGLPTQGGSGFCTQAKGHQGPHSSTPGLGKAMHAPWQVPKP